MKLYKPSIGKSGLICCGALCGALAGCTMFVDQPHTREAYVRPSPVYVEPPSVQVRASVGVVIRTEEDFYEPLREYGRWEVVGSHGRCWIPGRVESGWRPYSHGSWQRTDAGWYWASEEPWAWATYHYGRWDLSPQLGWYWVPLTQWSPAWVSWHEGGGYVGWAPLQPSARISVGGSVAVDVARIAPQAFVFVEPRRFLQPVRPTTVVVNNTTVINQTVNITNIKVVNNTVINEGPRTQIIEQASGQQVQAVPARELRRTHEAGVVVRQPMASPGRVNNEKNVPAPARSEAQPRVTRSPSDAERGVKKAETPPKERLQRNLTAAEKTSQAEMQRLAKEAAEKAQDDTRRQVRDSEQLKGEQRAKESQRKAQSDAQQAAKDLETKTRLESQRSAKEAAAAKAQEEARRQVREVEQLKAEKRVKEMDKKAQSDAQQAAKDLDTKTRLESQRRLKEAEVKARDDKARKKKGKASQPPPETPPLVPPLSPENKNN